MRKGGLILTIIAVISCIVLAIVFLQPRPAVEPVFTPQTAPVVIVEPAVVETIPGVLQSVNDYRASKGLPLLNLNAELTASANAKAIDLTTKQYWSHISPEGVEPWSFFIDAGYIYSVAAENLARCFATSESIVNGWIKSPIHESVLTGDYNDVGFGTATNAQDSCEYVVGHFGSHR